MRLLILLCLVAGVCHAGVIENIAHVEGDSDTAVGRHGERSRWQLMPYVRRHYPGTDWANPAEARRAVVAELNLRSAKFMRAHGAWPTPFQQALLWHCPARVDHPATSDLDYARRVVALGI